MRVTNRSDRQGNHLSLHGKKLIMAAAVSALVVQSGRVMASSIWTGPSGTTSVPTAGNWNTAANWSPSGVPAGGVTQELDFLGGSTVYTSTDDISGVFSLNSLVLNDIGSTIAAGGGNSLSFQGTSPAVQQSAAGAFTISAPVDISSNTAISVANGGEIDFTGAVTTGTSNGISISNSSGTGNAIVKFTGANTNATLTVNPNVTAMAGLSSNLTTLGSGTVTLAGGKLMLQGQQANGFTQQPIGINGFNADTIVDAAASTTLTGPPAHSANATVTDNSIEQGSPPVSNGTVYTSSHNVEASDITTDGHIHNQTTLFQNGWNGKTTGIAANGLITSTATSLGTNHVFNFGYNGSSTNFADNNTLYFTNGGITDMAAKTLTLANPTQVHSLDFLANAYVSSSFDVTLNFSDTTSSTYSSAIVTGSYTSPTNLAYTVKGTNNGNSNVTDNGATVKFDENDITLSPSDQAKTLSSITFTPTSIGTTTQTLYNSSETAAEGTASIYAVSGVAFGTGVLQAAQNYSNNIAVTADSSIDISNSLTASVGNLSTTANLAVTSSSGTSSPYSLTVGNVTLTGNAGFSVANSTGGGVGTLYLGALNDNGTGRTVSINSGTGTIILTAAASSLSAGTNINVPTGATLNIAAGNAVGAAAVNINGGTVNGMATDGQGQTPSVYGSGNYLVNSGTLNEASSNGLGLLAQVTMAGGTFNVGAGSQISSLNDTGTLGTVNLNNQYLVVGNTDNLSSSFGGLITGNTSSNVYGALVKSGTGTFTVTGATNSQLMSGVLQGTLVVGGNSTVNGVAYTAASATPVHGQILGPAGSGIIEVGPGGGNFNASLYLDAPGRTLPNIVEIGSGGASTAVATVGGLNTTGVATFAGDIYLGTGDQGVFGITDTPVLAASNGGEVDFSGNIIANHNAANSTQIPLTNPLAIRNLSGTGSAIVKVLGQNNTYRNGTEIDPNVTFVSALSGSTRTLGYGPVNLVGGTLALQGQQASGTQLANLVTNAGFNQAIIVPRGAASALAATTSTIDGSSVLYQNGFNGAAGVGPTGLNDSGTYTSEYNPDVKFQLQPYTGNTALQLQSGAAPKVSTGTLTLASPAAFKTINILTSNGNGATSVNVTFNFADSTTETQTLITQNWYFGHIGPFGQGTMTPSTPGGPSVSLMQRLAIGGLTNGSDATAGLTATPIGSIQRSNDAYTNYPAAMYEDDYTLAPADQSKILNSITFTVSNYLSQTSTDNIMAISGQTYVPPTTLATQTFNNNVNVTSTTSPSGTIDVSGSLNAVMGNNLSIGNNTLNVTSSDGTTSPYSLTLGTLPDTLDALHTAPAVSLLANTVGGGPTFNVANSAGGGTGTLVLGALDDTNAYDPNNYAHIPQVITKTGPGAVTLSAPAKVPTPTNTSVTGETSALQGATVNVNVGTLNSNDPTALGTTAIVTVASNLNFGANDNTGTSPVPVTVASLSVGAAGNVSVLNAGSQADRTVLVVTGPNGLAITTGGTVDLNKNDMIVQGGSLSTVTAELKSGFAAGSGYWNGTGIRSTSAATDPTLLTTLGVMSSTGATFDGQPTSVGDVLVKYTYYGDADLTGHVDGNDYTLIDNGFGSGGSLTGWQNGDFNYDGFIDGSDYSLIDNTFNQQSLAGFAAQVATPTSEIAGASAAVPEPATLGLFGISAVGLLSRRRRRD
jgi:PEP-CTERM motif